MNLCATRYTPAMWLAVLRLLFFRRTNTPVRPGCEREMADAKLTVSVTLVLVITSHLTPTATLLFARRVLLFAFWHLDGAPSVRHRPELLRLFFLTRFIDLSLI